MGLLWTSDDTGDDRWHRYEYDEAFDGDDQDRGLTGRVITDELLDGYRAATETTTYYTYFNDIQDNIDVQTKEFIHATEPLENTYATYDEGTGAGILTQWLDTLVMYYYDDNGTPLDETDDEGDKEWHRYTYDEEFDTDTTDDGLSGRVTIDEVLDGYLGNVKGTKYYTYYNNILDNYDVQLVVFDHETINTLDTETTYYEGSGLGTDSQYIHTHVMYYAFDDKGNTAPSDDEGDIIWNRYTYDI